MAEHPLISIYILGIYAWMAILGYGMVVRRHQFKVFADDAARQLGVSPRTFVIVIGLAYTVAWPLTVLYLLANIATNGKR